MNLLKTHYIMLEVNTNKTYVKHWQNDCPYTFISRPYDGNNGSSKIIFTYLTDQEESKLEAEEDITITRGNLTFTIRHSLLYAFGDLDLNPGSELLKQMHDAVWLNKVYVKQFVPSNYNFETHTSKGHTKLGGWYDTANPSTFIPFLWNCLNKPRKVVIFKDYHDALLIKKKEEELRKRREKRKEKGEKVTETNYYKKQQQRIKELKFKRANLKIN